ncbi:MAG: hypothetical protein AAF975_09540, partial [Spirochaetota bacterium]
DLRYKMVSGGSWLNALPVGTGSLDLWRNEFWREGNELPVAITGYDAIAGQFSGIRSPYTGFRLLAERKSYGDK